MYSPIQLTGQQNFTFATSYPHRRELTLQHRLTLIPEQVCCKGTRRTAFRSEHYIRITVT